MDHTWWVVSMPKGFRWRNEPGGQKRWKRRWPRHLGKRCAFPTFPPLRRRRGLYLEFGKRTSSRATKSGHLHVLTTEKSAISPARRPRGMGPKMLGSNRLATRFGSNMRVAEVLCLVE